MTETPELLPCPFCGKPPHSSWQAAGYEIDDCGYWAIECCSVHIHQDDEEMARKLWNTRVPPSTVGVESLADRLSFAEFEWNRATDGMKERDAEIERLTNQLVCVRSTLRKLAIVQHVRLAEGGKTVPNGKSCKVCGREWYDDLGHPEDHYSGCHAAITDDQG